MNNTPIKIERGIKIPPKAGGGGRNRIYPFGDMKVGDSLSVPFAKRAAINCAAYQFRIINKGIKFTTRGDKKAGVARIWRTA